MDPYCSEVPIDYRAERPKRYAPNIWWAFIRVLFRSWDEREYDYERRRQRSRSKEKETRRRDRSRSRERWRNEDCDHGDRPRGRRVSCSRHLSPCVFLRTCRHVAWVCTFVWGGVGMLYICVCVFNHMRGVCMFTVMCVFIYMNVSVK